jgi:hypothetical protein
LAITTVSRIVSGTFADGDTNATAGSIAKAINDVTNGVSSVQSITLLPVLLGSLGSKIYAIIIYVA